MVLLSDYPFLDVMWTMLVFFLWVAWFWILFGVWGDIFRRRDLSGGGKTGWFIFTLVLPFLGVFIYVISQNDGMNQRNLERAQADPLRGGSKNPSFLKWLHTQFVQALPFLQEQSVVIATDALTRDQVVARLLAAMERA